MLQSWSVGCFQVQVVCSDPLLLSELPRAPCGVSCSLILSQHAQRISLAHEQVKMFCWEMVGDRFGL